MTRWQQRHKFTQKTIKLFYSTLSDARESLVYADMLSKLYHILISSEAYRSGFHVPGEQGLAGNIASKLKGLDSVVQC